MPILSTHQAKALSGSCEMACLGWPRRGTDMGSKAKEAVSGSTSAGNMDSESGLGLEECRKVSVSDQAC